MKVRFLEGEQFSTSVRQLREVLFFFFSLIVFEDQKENVRVTSQLSIIFCNCSLHKSSTRNPYVKPSKTGVVPIVSTGSVLV